MSNPALLADPTGNEWKLKCDLRASLWRSWAAKIKIPIIQKWRPPHTVPLNKVGSGSRMRDLYGSHFWQVPCWAIVAVEASRRTVGQLLLDPCSVPCLLSHCATLGHHTMPTLQAQPQPQSFDVALGTLIQKRACHGMLAKTWMDTF
ncbi:hypothetical protein MHYP_G00065060 [Metynnis hypsauchen]